MSKPIKEQKLLYHLTSLRNFQSICKQGLLARSSLDGFIDIADPEIIEKRKELCLLDYVPFHFFFKNPFDGRVQKDHPDENLIYIAVWRSVAREKGWKILPKHPASCKPFILYDYDSGYDAIDWVQMERRDYRDDTSRSVCMAECLCHERVGSEDFAFIYTKDAHTLRQVKEIIKATVGSSSITVDERNHYFVGAYED